MALVNTMDILRSCKTHKYAVGAFNINSLDQPKALIDRAGRLASPIMLVIPGIIEKYVDFDDFSAVAARAARHSEAPVALHLSHGTDLEQVRRACEAGFTSAMFDGSKLPFEENIAQTKLAVEIGHEHGCAVEGELGAIGSSFASVAESLTDPMLAKEFVSRTGVDILAVSIGNAHGFYKGAPKLDFAQLEAIEKALSGNSAECCLTLHGGTGIPPGDIKRAIALGITKICIYTEMCAEGKIRAKGYIDGHPEYAGNYDVPELLAALTGGFADVMQSCAEAFMSVGRADAVACTRRAQIKDPGPPYPSYIAENDGFVASGSYWGSAL